jgi:hypothetical protein
MANKKGKPSNCLKDQTFLKLIELLIVIGQILLLMLRVHN